MKSLLVVFCILSALGCSSAPVKRVSLGNEVFGVAERRCRGIDTQKAFCESIQLVELVRGVFYKVKPSETAFVVWHGPRKDLSYSAHNLGQVSLGKPSSITIVQDPAYVEEFAIDAQGAMSYSFGSPDTPSSLILKKLQVSDLEAFARKYPED
ncbi:MAG: hypothetical protein RJA63_1663 [Pseudomonadota bacterium]|jgi:hypothetical protein